MVCRPCTVSFKVRKHEGSKYTHQSPHSVMSNTICCAPKNCGMLHVEAVYAAEGGPHVEMSIESVAVVIDGGMFARCGLRGQYA